MSERRVVVVGAGPAGAAAAITCALEGLDVELLEAGTAPLERPGETLHPGVEPLFEKLGVRDAVNAAGFLRHEGVRVAWGEPERFQAYGEDASGPWRGYQAWRSTLDDILRERATQLGVRVVTGCRASGPVMRQGRVAGVITPRGELEADWVVDATGSKRAIARGAGLAYRELSPKLFVRYGYLESPAGQAPQLVADGAGWTWTAEVRRGEYQWTRLDFGERTAVTVGGKDVGNGKGADVTWRLVEAAAAPGLFVVGDAAAILDPSSSHGVLRALMSGMHAGWSIARIAKREAPERVVCASYRDWTRDWIEHDTTELKKLYAKLPAPP